MIPASDLRLEANSDKIRVEAFPSLSSDFDRAGQINPWINAKAQISETAVWLNLQHHSVSTPEPPNLTPQLRRVVIQL